MSERSSRADDSRVFSQASGRKSSQLIEDHFVSLDANFLFFLTVDDQSHFSGQVAFPAALSLRSASQATSTANAPVQQGGKRGRSCIGIDIKYRSLLDLVAMRTKDLPNPFRIPPENDIFNLRDQEKMKQKEVSEFYEYH
jgi:hypothetical protein